MSDPCVGPLPTYQPHLALYRSRKARREATGQLPTDLPVGLTSRIEGDIAWEGSNLAESDYVFHLTSIHFSEIRAACEKFHASGQALDDISASTFPLPTLSLDLAAHRHTITRGRGFVLLRGLDPTQFSRRGNVILFAGICSHLSTARGTQASGTTLVHIKDLSSQVRDGLCGPHTKTSLPFHNDYSDTVAMYVLCPSFAGGSGLLASASAVYNRIASKRPDLIATLTAPDWPFARPVHDDGSGYQLRPLMFLHDGAAETMYSRGGLVYSDVSQRSPELPVLNDAQAEALDAVQFTAAEVQAEVKWLRGDVLLFSNRRIVHGRTGFSDDEDSGWRVWKKKKKDERHMLRLWLKDEMALEAPEVLKDRWELLFDGEPAGREGESVMWPMEPIPLGGKERASGVK